MRLVGLLLLIAVLVVGFTLIVTELTPAPPPPVAAALPAPEADPRLDELEAQITALEEALDAERAQPESRAEFAPAQESEPVVVAQQVETARPSHGCVATPGNAHAASPTLTVASGHLLSVQWYYDGGPQEQSVLSAGTWVPKAGVRVGAFWDYPDCDEETVINQAIASNGSVTDPSNGFARS